MAVHGSCEQAPKLTHASRRYQHIYKACNDYSMMSLAILRIHLVLMLHACQRENLWENVLFQHCVRLLPEA